MRKMINIQKRFLTEQRGNILVIVAAAMLMIFGFTAIVIDGGSLYFEKSRLQNSIDASVLAGAQGLPVSENNAKSIAIDIADKNGLTLAESEIVTGSSFIEVTKTIKKDLTFAKILGINDADVTATARAELKGGMVEANGAIPVALPSSAYKKGDTYKLISETSNNGNFHFLAPGDNRGANDLKQAIINGTPIGRIEKTEPGRNTGPVYEGFKARIEADKNKPHCQDWRTADNTCQRLVIVPLVENFDGINGRKDVPIIGFAALWIAKSERKQVYGVFIEGVGSGTFEEGKPTYGVYTVKLVK